ncbi:response regulator receiver domain protein [Leptospira ryugenii]|uniref:Sensory/regulatory protein RpfC n=2 Tax=Leptospira ryugenii TaxID=1917863 RepID=A0A2P2DVF0_9LEPT|nr:response regulator receiver domain protein [Leptospira ryugenii]
MENASIFFDIISLDDRDRFFQSLESSIQDGNSWELEWRIQSNLKPRWLYACAKVLEKDDGFHWYAILKEISERKETESEYIIHAELETLLVRRMQEGVIVHDLDGKVTFINSSAERILGLSYKQIVGISEIQNSWHFVDESGKLIDPEFHPTMVTLRTLEPITDFTMGIQKPDGEITWISVNTEILYHPEKKIPIKVFAVFHDITTSKKYETLLISAKQKAEAADRIKTSFLANMSHEIRTPLNAIIGYTELLLDANLTEEVGAQLRIIRNSGNLLLNIINDILDLSKIDANQMKIDEYPVSFKEISERIKESASILISKKTKPIQWKQSIDENLPTMFLGDENRILQIILNLVNNAIKFTEEGEIEFRIEKDKEEIVFSIRDTGKGIFPENYERIFQPFQQEDFGDARKYGGTGLGLTISKKLIESMGGKIRFVSSVLEDHGTVFYIHLPLKHVIPEPYPELKVLHSELNNVSHESINILLADDDLVNQKLALRMLSQFNVKITSDGKEAFELYLQSNFDIIILDVQMPVMTGYEVASEIRKYELEKNKEKKTPIIFLSAAALKEDQERGLHAGGNAYLTKPIKKQSLIDTILKLVSLQNPSSNYIISK